MKLNVPHEVVYCRGRVCHDMAGCSLAEACKYKSSAEEFKERAEIKTVTTAVKETPALDLDARKPPTPVVRVFETGANRDVDTNKLDFEGFLAPSVLQRFAEYMHKNRFLRDGSMRDSDNWQKGIPRGVYIKSMWRHFFAVWRGHRLALDVEEELCALMFNVMGYLFELLKAKNGQS